MVRGLVRVEINYGQIERENKKYQLTVFII